MSMTGILIVGILLGAKLILKTWLMLRQRRALSNHRHAVPEAFATFFTLDEHQKASDYGQARLNFAILKLWFDGVILALWFATGALAYLDMYLFTVIPHSIWQPLTLLFSVSAIGGLLSLPWSLWSQFKLEAKFGFNRTTLGTFFADRIKGMILGAIFGLALGYPFVLTMHNVPGLWFVPAFIVYLIFQVLIMWLWPTVIAPLFNKFSPLEEGTLNEGIKKLVEEADFQSSGVYVMDASKRSTHGNAYFTGIGKAKRIVFFDTILKKLSPTQVLAVLAHEVGHLSHGHVRKRLFVSIALSACAFMLMGWFAMRADLFLDLGLTQTHGVVLLVSMWLGGLLSTPLSPLFAHWSRKHEFEADRYAIARTSAADLGEALLALYRGNAGSVVVDPIYAAWTYSHPPLSERLKAMPYPAEPAKD